MHDFKSVMMLLVLSALFAVVVLSEVEITVGTSLGLISEIFPWDRSLLTF